MQTEELLSACRTPTPNTPITIEFKYQSRRELLDELYWIGAKFIKFPGLQEAGEGMSPHCLISWKNHLHPNPTNLLPSKQEYLISELSVPHTLDPGFY